MTQIKAEKDDQGLDGIVKEVGPGWELTSRIQRKKPLKGHFGKVYSMHWASDSVKVVSASQDGKLIIWNAASTNKLQAIPLRSSWVMTTCFEQETNGFVACGGLDNLCSVYDLSSSASVMRASAELSGHDGYLSCCRFRGKEEILTSSGDSVCCFWNVESQNEIMKLEDHDGDVMSCEISPIDRNVVITGSCDSTAKAWDLRTGKCTFTFRGHETDINSIAWFPSGQQFGTGSDDSSARLWDIRYCGEVKKMQSEKVFAGITSVAFSLSGRLMFVGSDDYNCYVWDTLGPASSEAKLTLSNHDNRVSCLGVNACGVALCTGSWDTVLNVWS